MVILLLLFWAPWLVPSLAVPLETGSSMDTKNKLIGWQGDSFDPQEFFGGAKMPVQISQKPLAHVWRKFISRDEAKHIAQLASRRMKRSMVGGSNINEVRTSYGMFIPRYYDTVLAGIEERISKWTGLPVVNQEEMQVLRYDVGQNYKQHMDANGRMCTLLIYLTDTPYGGETAFPSTTDEHWLDPSMKPSGLSTCADGHVAVKPEVGTALLFYSMPPGAEKNESLRVVDPFSMHTGCPPIKGHKWTSTVWVHFDPFRPNDFSTKYKKALTDPGLCSDHNPQCQRWAESGECEKNSVFMKGAPGGEGNCMVSCKLCEPCDKSDAACLGRTREKLGFIGDLSGELQDMFGQ